MPRKLAGSTTEILKNQDYNLVKVNVYRTVGFKLRIALCNCEAQARKKNSEALLTVAALLTQCL